MEAIIKAHLKHIRTLISACRLQGNRADLAKRYGYEDINDMPFDDLRDLRAFMEAAYRGKTTEPSAEIRALRSLCLMLLNRIGVYITDGDWSAVNRFLLNLHGVGKLLYMMERHELEALSRRLRGIEYKAVKGRDKKTATRMAEAEARRSSEADIAPMEDSRHSLPPSPEVVIPYAIRGGDAIN